MKNAKSKEAEDKKQEVQEAKESTQKEVKITSIHKYKIIKVKSQI